MYGAGRGKGIDEIRRDAATAVHPFSMCFTLISAWQNGRSHVCVHYMVASSPCASCAQAVDKYFPVCWKNWFLIIQAFVCFLSGRCQFGERVCSLFSFLFTHAPGSNRIRPLDLHPSGQILLDSGRLVFHDGEVCILQKSDCLRK